MKSNDIKSPTPTQPPKPKAKFETPYQIESFINSNTNANLEEIWEYWGIGTNVKGFGDVDDTKFMVDCIGCEATTFEYDLEGDLEPEVLLHIKGYFMLNRFMVFKYKENSYQKSKWTLLGYIDHDLAKYEEPNHMVFISNGRKFLIINHLQEASGVGVALYIDRVFEFNNEKMKEVLSYTSDGQKEGLGAFPARTFSAGIADYKREKDSESITISYKVKYSTFDLSDSDIFLWRKYQKAVYRRGVSSKVFEFDKTKSDVSEKEIEAVYNVDTLTNESLFQYNRHEIVSIAKGNNKRKKEWLCDLLSQVKNTPRYLLDLMKVEENQCQY